MPDVSEPYRFANFELHPVQRELRIEGKPVPVGARAFGVLLALIERRGRVVTKNELLDVVWLGLVVEENNLAAQVSALRKVLGANAIATIPGIGYRFALPLQGDDWPSDKAPTTADANATNIPESTESLIGRKADQAAVSALLASHRLVTITGAGGVGKTRLAQEVARARMADFRHGVWWVDLATVPTADLIVPAIAQSASLRLEHGELARELAAAIGERCMLLILDNVEHVSEHAARISKTVLEKCPAIRFLITSQEILKTPFEAVHVLDGLFISGDASPFDLARECAALQLLERRVRAIDGRFAIDVDNFTAALELCRRLDGIALAIEMAAARIPILGLEALLSRLGARLGLLATHDRGRPERHRTLRATLEWSYSLLTAPEQAVFRKLSIFTGSFNLDSVQCVTRNGALDEWEAVDCLSALVEKSLVRVVQLEPPRYRLLETSRLFGLERLAQHGELLPAMDAHSCAMSALSEVILDRFDRENELACLRAFEPDYDDLRAAWERGCERGDSESATGPLMALTTIDYARGHYLPMWGRKVAARDLLAGAAPLPLARLWHCIALIRPVPCPGISLLEATQEEVAAWRRVGDRRRLFDALGHYVEALAYAGRSEEAEAMLPEMASLRDFAPSAQARLIYPFVAYRAALAGRNLALILERIEDLDQAARAVPSVRFVGIAKLGRLTWAIAAGEVRQALELGSLMMQDPFYRGSADGMASAKALYATALMLAGQLEEVPSLLAHSLQFASRSISTASKFDAMALYGALVGEPRTAMRLLGYADAIRAAFGEIRRPIDEQGVSHVLDAVAKLLGSEESNATREAGRQMVHAEALQVAEMLVLNRRTSQPLPSVDKSLGVRLDSFP